MKEKKELLKKILSGNINLEDLPQFGEGFTLVNTSPDEWTNTRTGEKVPSEAVKSILDTFKNDPTIPMEVYGDPDKLQDELFADLHAVVIKPFIQSKQVEGREMFYFLMAHIPPVHAGNIAQIMLKHTPFKN